MAKQKDTYWFDGRQISEDEAFDENGIMRDGVGTRVRTMMRDGIEVAEGIMMHDTPVPLGYQLVTDGEGRTLTDAFGTPLSPHHGRKGYTFVDNSNCKRPIDDSHPDVQKAYLSNAWKGGHFELGDQVVVEGRPMVGTHYTHATHVEFVDINTLDGDELKKRAFDEYKAHLSGAWKKQKEPDEREWECGGPLSDSESSEIKEQAWRDSVTDLENAWKK